MEKMIQIPEWQLKEIEDTLRLANNIHHSQRKETCFDRCVCKAWDFAKGALAKADTTSEKDLRVCEVSNSLPLILGLDNPYPLRDVLERLKWATNYLLHEKNYDGHSYEELNQCVRRANEIIAMLNGNGC